MSLPVPAPATLNVLAMSPEARVGEAMRRSLPMLPGEARNQLMAMLTRESLAIIAGTMVVWAGSHVFGVGQVVDVVLLAVGFVTLGTSIFSGSRALCNFILTAVHARTDDDLNRAAHHFAKGVTLLGINVVSAVLLCRSAQAVKARGMPKIQPKIDVGPPPAPGTRPTISRVDALPNNARGTCDWYGNVAVRRNLSISDQRAALFHELFHRFFTPTFGPMRQLRAEMAASTYWRSSLVRYLAEAMAQAYGQLRVYGVHQALAAVRFPIKNGYVTISQMITEGVAIGNITLGGGIFTVRVVKGNLEAMLRR